MPKKNKHYARYVFLKTRPEAGVATLVYARFCDTQGERILEHLIQTIENQQLIQKCMS